jgi:putative DNA primase/helicase
MTTPKPAANVVDFADHKTAEQAAKDLVPVLSEHTIALEFVDRHIDMVRFDCTSRSWHIWNGGRWKRDETNAAAAWTRSVVASMAADQNAPDRRRLGSRRFAMGVEGFAQTDQRITVTRNHWDRDVDLIGTPTGVVDLKSGEFFDPTPGYFITKSTTVDPDITIDCPRWLKFLDEITESDKALKQFLQLWFGYSLTAETREQKLAFLYGKGGRGKGTLAHTLRKLMGDYATMASMETFTDSKFDGHPEQLARLASMRMVVSSETEEGHRWRENRIKLLTGGDAITARNMGENSFTYEPTAKFTFLGNRSPTLNNVDEAMRRRFIVVPFDHAPVEVDTRLDEVFAKEAAGILRWAIHGAVAWYNNGQDLILPKAISEATTRYFDEQNIFGQWLDECCRVEPDNEYLTEKTAALFASWQDFARRHGEEPGKQKDFNEKLRDNGFDTKQIKTLGTTGCRGIQLKIKHAWQDDR